MPEPAPLRTRGDCSCMDADADAGAVVFMRVEADVFACVDAYIDVGVDVDVDVDAGDAGTCVGSACVCPSLILPSWAAGACPCARAGMKPCPPPFTPPDDGDDASTRPDVEGDCRECDCPLEEPAWRSPQPAGVGFGVFMFMPVGAGADAGVDVEAVVVLRGLSETGPAVPPCGIR